MPFHSTRVWFELAPRVKTEAAFPGEPSCVVEMPGRVPRTEKTSVVWRAASSSASTTDTAAGKSDGVSSPNEAVTTTDSEKDGWGEFWAKTGIAPPRIPAQTRRRRIDGSFA